MKRHGVRKARLSGKQPRPSVGTLLAVGTIGVFTVALWLRRHPSTRPYGRRILVQVPHPIVTRNRLAEILEPRRGEQLLEVGPGAGYYTLAVARQIAPEGRLDILDVSGDMVTFALARARQSGLDNVNGTRGDACLIPYPDEAYDAAFLVLVLGEVTDQTSALRELRRVLKPGGRLVVGEMFGDPNMVTFGSLYSQASAAGFHFERRIGGPLGYFARFVASSAPLG